jgi:hypothetical protein
LTDGAFSDDGAFHPLERWDGDAIMELFRERLLSRLIERHAISQELARKLLAWRHPGFSAHVGDAIPFEDQKAIEDVACYIVRNPLSLKKLVVRRARVNRARLSWRNRCAIPGLDGQKAVLYRSRMNPSLGRNFEALGPLEWLARLADHIPDLDKHRTHFHAPYANRLSSARPCEERGPQKQEEDQPKKRRCSPSWARLIAKVFQADPLVCKRCGGPFKVVAYITDTVAIRRILDHLGLTPGPQQKPPPVREVLRVAEHAKAGECRQNGIDLTP